MVIALNFEFMDLDNEWEESGSTYLKLDISHN